MAIRLSSTCTNCSSMSTESFCQTHEVNVGSNYTCDHFSLKSDMQADRDCLSCVRHNSDTCAHPTAAAEGMLCKSWAPEVA